MVINHLDHLDHLDHLNHLVHLDHLVHLAHLAEEQQGLRRLLWSLTNWLGNLLNLKKIDKECFQREVFCNVYVFTS